MRASPYLHFRLQRLQLNRGGRRVLHDIDWNIAPGQHWVLLGGNGAGKTQLLKLVAGSIWPAPARHQPRIYTLHGQSQSEPQGIQDEIAYLGPERQDKYERYGWNHRVDQVVGTGLFRTDIPLNRLTAADRERVGKLLNRLGAGPLARRRLLTLSYGERRLVLVARALASNPKLLLMDELFTGLDETYRARLLRWLERTSRSRLPWVLASHRLEDIPAAATHLLVLEKGRITYKGPVRKSRIAQALKQARQPKARPTAARRTPERDPSLFRLADASVYQRGTPILRDISLAVHSGECWVIHGPNGSGKSTLLRAIYGDHPVRGTLERAGIAPGVPIEQFKLQVGWVAPTLQSLHPQYLTVLETVQSGRYASIGMNDTPTRGDLVAARRSLRFFGLMTLERRTVRELSYGQLRRVLFARAWVNHPHLLLLDEPFSGVDTPTRAALLRNIEALLRSGVSVVMATHHREEWPQTATHELQLRAGRAIYCGPRREISNKQIL